MTAASGYSYDPSPQYPSWSEIKKVLDDPDVPEEHKRSLVRDIRADEHTYKSEVGHRARDADENSLDARDQFDSELSKYEQKFKVQYDKTSDAADGDDINDAYDAAKKAGNKESNYDDAVKGNKGALEDITRKASDGGAGCSNSNEILDKGQPALAYFANFGPEYKKLDGFMRENPPKGDFGKDGVQKRYDEQRDINFANFEADANGLKEAARKQNAQSQKMADRMKSVWGSWSGAASNASQQNFADINTGAAKVGDYLDNTAQVITDAIHHVSKACVQKADGVLDAITNVDTVGGRNSAQISCIIEVAKGTADDDTVIEVCGYFGIDATSCDRDDYTPPATRQAIKWLQTTFVPDFEAKYKAFDEICSTAKETVNKHWKTLTEHLGGLEEDPFKNPGGEQDYNPGKQGPGGQQGPGQQGSGGGPGTGGGPSGGGGTGGGGAGAGAGGGGTGGGAGAPETPKMPETPAMPEPPQMPQPTAPGAPGAEGEKVTLGAGEDAVSVQEPGSDGTTRVELIGEDGHPKAYAVDFGQGGPGAAEPGQMPGQAMPGQTGPGQAMPGQPVPGQPAPGQPVPGAPGADQVAGDQRQTGPQPVPVQPGPDGTAVIQEGDRTITLEQGQDGEIKVNVDNGGDKPPLNQTIDFGDEPQAPALGGEGVGGGPVPGEPPSFAPEAGPGISGGPVPGEPPASLAQDPVAQAERPAEPVTAPAAEASPPGFADSPAAAGAAGGTPGVPTAPTASGFGGPVPGEPAMTTPQASGMNAFTSGEGVQNSFGSAAGNLFGDDGAGPGEQPGGSKGSAGLSSLGGDDAAASPHNTGSTGMSSLGGDASGAGQQGQSSAATGGGMMGGGMMGGGAGQGQGGGDQERTNDSPWRTEGQLFDDGVEASNVRFRSVLGEDRDR